MSKDILRCCHFVTNTFCELREDKESPPTILPNILPKAPPIKHPAIGIGINVCPIPEPPTPQTVRLQHVHTYGQGLHQLYIRLPE